MKAAAIANGISDAATPVDGFSPCPSGSFLPDSETSPVEVVSELSSPLDVSSELLSSLESLLLDESPELSSAFGTITDMYFKSDAECMTLQGCTVLLGSSCLMLAAFVRPARKRFSKAVEELDMPKLWYSTTVISATFLVYNILVTPVSYDVVRNSRLRFLYPMFEVCALALLITVYVLFYGIVTGNIERERLEKRSQLLEMQSHQFRELQEYMRQTSRLRHDFKHSIHLLSTLAENGDLESIRAHLSEYDRRLSENVSVNYCSNAALNALFGYYREMADSQKIRTNWKIELPEPLTVSELDMAALFGNIMENAISACAALPEGKRYFNLTSELRHGKTLYVVSTNSFDGKVRKGKEGYHSTKHSGRGTGLISIAAVVEKYGGSAQFHNSDKEFYTDFKFNMGKPFHVLHQTLGIIVH